MSKFDPQVSPHTPLGNSDGLNSLTAAPAAAFTQVNAEQQAPLSLNHQDFRPDSPNRLKAVEAIADWFSTEEIITLRDKAGANAKGLMSELDRLDTERDTLKNSIIPQEIVEEAYERTKARLTREWNDEVDIREAFGDALTVKGFTAQIKRGEIPSTHLVEDAPLRPIAINKMSEHLTTEQLQGLAETSQSEQKDQSLTPKTRTLFKIIENAALEALALKTQ